MPGGFLDPQPSQPQPQQRRSPITYGRDLRGRSGAQVRNPQTGQMEDQAGRFQGGTSNRRAGLPTGGIVGAPDLGTASELMRWAGQVPGGMEYLQSMGIMPSINSTQVTNMGNVQGSRGLGQRMPGMDSLDMSQGTPAGPAFGGRSPNIPGMSGSMPGQLPQIPAREQSPFERQIQGNISSLMNNPRFENSLRTREGERVSGMTASANQRAQEDAVRRGASTQAGGDSDIRDQLNRVQAEGTRQGREADLGIDQLMQQLKLQGVQAGTGLLGQQLGDVRSLREMITLLSALQQQNGPTGTGLQFALGGR